MQPKVPRGQEKWRSGTLYEAAIRSEMVVGGILQHGYREGGVGGVARGGEI